MATEFKLPNLGENVESGDIVSILVSEGDEVAEDQPVLELETDKATVEVPSNVRGKVTEIHVSEGDSVEVGQLILTLEEGDAAPAESEQEEADQEEAVEAVSEAKEQEQEEEETREEDEEPKVAARTRGAEKGAEGVESRGAVREAEAPSRKGEVVDFRDRSKAEPVSGQKERLIPASPAVRRFAREIGIDISRVTGSGPRGRISVEDVKSYSREQRSGQTEGPLVPSPSLPDFSKYGEITRESFSNVRRATARQMATAWTTIPHVTQHDEADITRLEELRKEYSPQVEEAGGKLTVTSIALKILVAALKKFPSFNASIDVENEEVIYKQYFHIGVAVDTERGLLVPVIRDVDKKSIVGLSVELSELAERTRAGKISLDQLQGGCMTVTNLGGIGGTLFTPIVNFPEVAILGISRASEKPVYTDGELLPRTILPLSLSYDHRLVDGADAARFLRFVARSFEDPFLMVLEA